jgi:hypothetical protein
MAFNFTDPNINEGDVIKKAHIQELINCFENIKVNTKFNPAITVSPRNDSVASNAPKKVSLEDLRTYINQVETKFTNNCNCLVNENCCQTCQSTTCQSQSCQTSACQTCQSQCTTPTYTY